MHTLYWHDYETWGATPAVDRPSQFAGVRTDLNLNIIGDPLTLYCQPPEDIWPQPEACLITGISPQRARDKGLPEREFIAAIARELATPHTCTVGYNSLRFDDEVTRYTLFRNYFDPYEREWRNGNSRWDIIDMLRLVYALRPEDIHWPQVDGRPSFKLELLTAANGIAHHGAHDAYADVAATIALARLVKQKKPALYDYVFSNRGKKAAAQFIDLQRRKPLLHISSRFPASRGCAALVAPLAMHPSNANAVIVFDLSVDPAPLASLSAEQIRARVFTAEADLAEGEQRLPLKLVHLNKCPVLATPKLLDAPAAARLGIDREACERHWRAILGMDIADKLRSMYLLDQFDARGDADTRLYDGFIGDGDKRLMAELRNSSADDLGAHTFAFEDRRLVEMLLPYRARNVPASLSPAEQHAWWQTCRERLQAGGDRRLSYADYRARIVELAAAHGDQPGKLALLAELGEYGAQLAAKYRLDAG